MIIHIVGAHLGGVQRFYEVACGDTPLATVAGCIVRRARYNKVIPQLLEIAGAGGGGQEVASSAIGIARIPVGAALVENGAFPVILVEQLNAQIAGYPHAAVEHAHRQQGFLDLRTGLAQCGNIEGVDHIDAVLDEGVLTPAQHHVAGAQFNRLVCYINTAVYVVIQKLETLFLREGFEIREIQFLIGNIAIRGVAMRYIALREFVVVPVLEAREYPEGAIGKIKVVHALEEQGVHVALVVVQVAVIRHTGRGTPFAVGVAGTHHPQRRIFRTPAGAHGKI